jgi:hypothetical protein
MTTKRDAIRSVYRQVHAPEWAAANLDGLADVLRDLSWLPAGRVEVRTPVVSDPAEQRSLDTVLARAADESAGSARPITLVPDG